MIGSSAALKNHPKPQSGSGGQKSGSTRSSGESKTGTNSKSSTGSGKPEASGQQQPSGSSQDRQQKETAREMADISRAAAAIANLDIPNRDALLAQLSQRMNALRQQPKGTPAAGQAAGRSDSQNDGRRYDAMSHEEARTARRKDAGVQSINDAIARDLPDANEKDGQYQTRQGDTYWNMAKAMIGKYGLDAGQFGNIEKALQDQVGQDPRKLQPGQNVNVGDIVSRFKGQGGNRMPLPQKAPSSAERQHVHGNQPMHQSGLPSQHDLTGGRMTDKNFSLRNFKPEDLRSGDGSPLNLDADSAKRLDHLADWYKQRFNHPLGVVSGHRSHDHNRRVGGASKSQHVHGRAFDLKTGHLNHDQRREVIEAASRAGFKGIGVYKNNLHVDTAGTRAWGPNFRSNSVPGWARGTINNHLQGAYAGKPLGISRPDQLASSRQPADIQRTDQPAPQGRDSIYNRNHTMLNRANLTASGGLKRELDGFKRHYEKNRERYERVAERTNLPPELVGALHWRESNGNFGTYLHQGDPLGRPARRVPSNIPVFGKDQWEDAAVHALGMKRRFQQKYGITRNTQDPAALAAYAERYNGTGYASKGRVSPYTMSGMDVYKGGKYVADHVFSPSAVDRQIGVVPMLMATMSHLSLPGAETDNPFLMASR